MITLEMLNAATELAALTPEMREAIITLSRNDENTVIARHTGEIYRQMDESIKNATGIDRAGAEKTYDYLKRATLAYADKFKDYDSLKSQITTLTAEKASLEDKIAKGAGDEQLKNQLASVQAELATTKNQFNDLKAAKDKAEADHASALLGLRVDNEVARAKEGLKFKAGLSDAAIASLMNIAISEIKGFNPKYEGEAGHEVIRYYDDSGVVMNNPDNKLNPFTTKELLVRSLEKLDILDKGKGGHGAGGSGGSGGSGRTITAKSQVAAMDAIEKILISKGLVKGSGQYQTELQRYWDDNKCDELPFEA